MNKKGSRQAKRREKGEDPYTGHLGHIASIMGVR